MIVCPFPASSFSDHWNIWKCNKCCFKGDPLSHSQISNPWRGCSGFLETNGEFFFLLLFLTFTCREVTGKTEHISATFFFKIKIKILPVRGRWLSTWRNTVFQPPPCSALEPSSVPVLCWWLRELHEAADTARPPSPASTTCDPDLMFQLKGGKAYFFLSVNFKEINIASGVTF